MHLRNSSGVEVTASDYMIIHRNEDGAGSERIEMTNTPDPMIKTVESPIYSDSRNRQLSNKQLQMTTVTFGNLSSNIAKRTSLAINKASVSSFDYNLNRNTPITVEANKKNINAPAVQASKHDNMFLKINNSSREGALVDYAKELSSGVKTTGLKGEAVKNGVEKATRITLTPTKR
jgi:hypothetical protein